MGGSRHLPDGGDGLRVLRGKDRSTDWHQEVLVGGLHDRIHPPDAHGSAQLLHGGAALQAVGVVDHVPNAVGGREARDGLDAVGGARSEARHARHLREADARVGAQGCGTATGRSTGVIQEVDAGRGKQKRRERTKPHHTKHRTRFLLEHGLERCNIRSEFVTHRYQRQDSQLKSRGDYSLELFCKRPVGQYVLAAVSSKREPSGMIFDQYDSKSLCVSRAVISI